MKIANIIEEARVGGPQLRILNVSKILQESGVSTTVVIPLKNSQRYSDMLINNNISYKVINIKKLSRSPLEIIKYATYFVVDVYKLYRFLKTEKFALVHVSGGSWQWKGLIAAKLANKKVVWHLNDTLMPKYILFIFKLLHKLPDGYIFAAHRVQTYYNKVASLNVYKHLIIQSPVDVYGAFNPKNVSTIELSGQHRVGMVANINPVKGIDFFINVVKHCNDNGLDAQYYIAGMVSNDEYYQKIQRLIETFKITNITFLGPTDNVPLFLNSIDIYLCTSVSEASPISVWEAMSMGKPIVSNDVGDVSLMFEKGKNGLISNFDEIDFSQKICTLVRNENKKAVLSANAREKAIREFELKKISRLHKEFYERVL